MIVPVYNSSPWLAELVRRLGTVLQATGLAHEVVLVDDGSRDESWSVLCGLAERHAWVRGLRMMRNYGQHNALLAGLRAARFDVTVTMDDDLQHPPEELPKLLDGLNEGCDLVYGPPQRKQHGLMRNLASLVTKFALQNSIGAGHAPDVCAFRAFRTRLREAFVSYHGPYVNIDVLLTWGTTRIGAVRVAHEPRAFGKSNYTFRGLLRHAIDMITGFSVLPLQWSSLIGFAFTVFGIGVLAYVLGRYLVTGSSVAGFPFLASIIAIFSGAQLFALGMIGEYLARMHFRLMEKPTYAIRDRTGGPSRDDPS